MKYRHNRLTTVFALSLITCLMATSMIASSSDGTKNYLAAPQKKDKSKGGKKDGKKDEKSEKNETSNNDSKKHSAASMKSGTPAIWNGHADVSKLNLYYGIGRQ